MRGFEKLREMVSTHMKLAAKLEELEQKYDEQVRIVFDVLHQHQDAPQKTNRRIGFIHDDS